MAALAVRCGGEIRDHEHRAPEDGGAGDAIDDPTTDQADAGGGETVDDAASDVDASAADASDGDASLDAPAIECQPGQLEACYEGPPGTEGVGLCVSGERLCGAGGLWGSCSGQVLPTEETCTTQFDDDCDGAVNEAGKDCACTVGTTSPCYIGPSATLGVGACKAGSQGCLVTGVGWGPCTASVGPAPESCATSADDDCDAEPECPGDVQWALDYEWQYLFSATRGAGSKLALLMHSPRTWAEVDPTGSHSVIQSHPTAYYTQHGPHVLGGDPAGVSELVAGTYDTVTPWEPLLPQVSGLFVMLRNGWQRGFAAEASLTLTSAVLNPSGSQPGWYLVGSLNGSLQLGTDMVVTGKAYDDPFLAKLASSNGDPVFGRRLFEAVPPSSPVHVKLGGLQATAQGVAVVGAFSDPLSLDGTVLSSKGNADVFVAVIDGNGDAVKSFTFGGGSDESAQVVGRPGLGPIVVAGTHYGMTIGTVDFAPGVYLLRFTDGLKPVSALQLSGCNLESAALDETTEEAYLALYCQKKDFGGGAIPQGRVLLAVDENNQHRFSRPLPQKAKTERLIVLDGALYLAGTFEGSVDFGTGPLTTPSPTQSEVFVARIKK